MGICCVENRGAFSAIIDMFLRVLVEYRSPSCVVRFKMARALLNPV